MPAQLDPTYETLVKGFLEAMNDIGLYGKKKYPDTCFEKQVAEGQPAERKIDRVSQCQLHHHARQHIYAYGYKIPHDHFGTRKHQLAAAAFNLMMEYYYAQLDDEV